MNYSCNYYRYDENTKVIIIGLKQKCRLSQIHGYSYILITFENFASG